MTNLPELYEDRSLSFKEACSLKLTDFDALKALAAFEVSYCLPLALDKDVFTLMLSKKDADNINKALAYAWLNNRPALRWSNVILSLWFITNIVMIGVWLWK